MLLLYLKYSNTFYLLKIQNVRPSMHEECFNTKPIFRSIWEYNNMLWAVVVVDDNSSSIYIIGCVRFQTLSRLESFTPRVNRLWIISDQHVVWMLLNHNKASSLVRIINVRLKNSHSSNGFFFNQGSWTRNSSYQFRYLFISCTAYSTLF